MGDLQRYRTLARHVEWQTLVCTLSHNGNHAFPLSGRRGFCPSVYFSQNIRLERYLSEDVEYADHGQQDDPHCERQRGHQGLDEQLAANLLGSLGEYDAAGAGQGRCRSGPNGGCEAQEHTGIKKSSLQKAIKALVKRKLIAMYKHRNPYGYSNNEYHLLSLDNPEIYRDLDTEADELPLFIGEELPA